MVYLFHKGIMGMPWMAKNRRAVDVVPEGEHLVPIGRAKVVREGADVTVVTLSLSVHHSLDVAEQLAGEGIGVEVLDLRSLVPLDREAILARHPHPLRPRPGVRGSPAARADRGRDPGGGRVTDLPFPPLDESNAEAEGVLATWYVQDGEQVAAGQLIAEVQVDKVDAEVAGTVRLLVAEDDAVRQGAPIARVE